MEDSCDYAFEMTIRFGEGFSRFVKREFVESFLRGLPGVVRDGFHG